MIRIAPLALMLMAPQHVPPPVVQAPPATVPVAPRSDDRFRLATFDPGAVVCDSGLVVPTRRELPAVFGGYDWTNGQPRPPGAHIDIRFSIDAAGRAIDIAQADSALPNWVNAADVMPALATWQLAAGAPHQGCRVSFAERDVPAQEAPPALAMRYIALPHGANPAAERTVFERTVAPGSDCFAPVPPAELVRVWPDFDTIPQPPGTRSFTMVGFDINARGKPVGAHILASAGNGALDAASLTSIRRSRFVAGARVGCSYPFRRTPIEPLRAPDGPTAAALRPGDADCDGVGPWTRLGQLTFPEPFRQRSIEGWGIVSFDVAPWGQTGNVKVLAAEPAEAFGTQAIQTVRDSTKGPSRRGYTGCVEKVVFKMGRPGEPQRTLD